MKKTLLTLFCAFTTLILGAQTAKTYSDNLVITINEESTAPIPADVIVTDNGDGTIDFSLANFCLIAGDNKLPVGNIAIDKLKLDDSSEGYKTFAYDGPLLITEGNLDGVDTWIGPMLGEIPLKLSGKMTEDKLFVTIDIDMMSTLEQIIYVVFGTDDFETGLQVVAARKQNHAVYDLSGRSIVSNSKGLYIQNGKIYIRK